MREEDLPSVPSESPPSRPAQPNLEAVHRLKKRLDDADRRIIEEWQTFERADRRALEHRVKSLAWQLERSEARRREVQQLLERERRRVSEANAASEDAAPEDVILAAVRDVPASEVQSAIRALIAKGDRSMIEIWSQLRAKQSLDRPTEIILELHPKAEQLLWQQLDSHYGHNLPDSDDTAPVAPG